MKIGLAVGEFQTNKVLNNIKKINHLAAIAKQKNLDLLCFGEAVFQGFHSLSGDFGKDIDIAMTRAEITKILINISGSNSIALALGYIEKENNTIYSSYIVIDKNGKLLCNYRRISTGWKERHWDSRYKEGDGFELFELCGQKFTIALCGDLWSDEKVLLKLKSDIVLWPVYIDYEYLDWTNGTAVKEYAEQSKIAGKDVFLVNSILHENKNRAEGRAIHFHRGTVVNQLEISKEDILVCEI